MATTACRHERRTIGDAVTARLAPAPSTEEATTAGTLADGKLGPVKALSKADRLRYHQPSPKRVSTRYPAEFRRFA